MLAVKPLVNIVSPVTVPPDKGKKGVAGKFWYVVADIVLAVKLCNVVSPVTVKLPLIVPPLLSNLLFISTWIVWIIEQPLNVSHVKPGWVGKVDITYE